MSLVTRKPVFGVCGCAGWSAPLLFGYGINRFSHDVAQKEHLRIVYILNTQNFKPTWKPACDFEIDLFLDDTNRIQYLATSSRIHTCMISQPLLFNIWIKLCFFRADLTGWTKRFPFDKFHKQDSQNFFFLPLASNIVDKNNFKRQNCNY